MPFVPPLSQKTIAQDSVVLALSPDGKRIAEGLADGLILSRPAVRGRGCAEERCQHLFRLRGGPLHVSVQEESHCQFIVLIRRTRPGIRCFLQGFDGCTVISQCHLHQPQVVAPVRIRRFK